MSDDDDDDDDDNKPPVYICVCVAIHSHTYKYTYIYTYVHTFCPPEVVAPFEAVGPSGAVALYPAIPPAAAGRPRRVVRDGLRPCKIEKSHKKLEPSLNMG